MEEETNAKGETKKQIIERIDAELGYVLTADDYLILEDWAFELGGI